MRYSTSYATTSSGRSAGSPTMAIRRTMATQPTRAHRATASRTRAGRTRAMRSSTPMAASAGRPSRWSKCRGTSTRRRSRSPRSIAAAATRRALSSSSARRPTCARASTATSGWTTRAPSRWRCRRAASRSGVVVFERRSGPLGRDRRRRQSAADGKAPPARRHVRRLGHSYASSDTRRYNPVGYHLGTVWPHDNSLIAAGFRRYALDDEAHRIFSGIIDAATYFDEHRLPEVFAGFARGDYDRPVHYPVACHPQAWAAGAVPYLSARIASVSKQTASSSG